MDKNLFIPTSKDDFETVTRLKKLPYDELRFIFPELLKWLQDLHWPIARDVAEILGPFVNEHSDDLIKVLRGNDGEWKLNILVLFGRTTKNISLLEEIRRIAFNPTHDEISQEVDIEAKNILSRQSDN